MEQQYYMFKYDPKMPKSEKISVVGVVPPIVPTFGVYLDFESGKLYTKPVVCYVIREFSSMAGDACVYTRTAPVMFDKDPNKMCEEVSTKSPSGFLGLTTVPEVKKEDWQVEIRDLKKFMKSE